MNSLGVDVCLAVICWLWELAFPTHARNGCEHAPHTSNSTHAVPSMRQAEVVASGSVLARASASAGCSHQASSCSLDSKRKSGMV